MSEGLLESIETEQAFLSVLPYRANWLKAEHLYISRSFDRVDREIEVALVKANRALAAHPELDLGIRHDIAEIESVLGGNAADAGLPPR